MSGIDLSPGERIREYEIVDLIGKGGMGAVYRARHVYLNCERAIKFIRPSLEGSSNFLHRFIREAKILSELSHPNLVRLYEFGESESEIFYIVMEFIIGQSVRKKIELISKIPVAESIHIIREAASALGCAHSNGIVHRDISPDNLMIVKSNDGTESTKVIDFGIAKSLVDSQALTSTDHFMGKPQYASPEQAGFLDSAEIDGRSDIYSLGITFYQMLSGTLPFSSATPQGFLFKHATETPKPISSHFPNEYFSPELEKVIARTLTKRREDRYQSMEDLISDLDRINTSDAATILLDVANKSGSPPLTTADIFESPVLSAPKRWPKLRLHWIAMLMIVGVASLFYFQTSTMRLEEPNNTPPSISPTQSSNPTTTQAPTQSPDPTPTQAPTQSPDPTPTQAPTQSPDPAPPLPEQKQSPRPVITEPKADVRTILLRSHPPGAEVFMNGTKIGTTPLKAKVISNEAKEFTLQLKGYDPVTRIIDRNSSDLVSVRLKPTHRKFNRRPYNRNRLEDF